MTKKNNKKVLILDLETSGLDANRGHILCAAAKWHGEGKVLTFRIDDNLDFGNTPKSFFNDSRIVRGLVALVVEASAVVAYYGGYGKFDIPFLNTRALANGLQPCPHISVIDPYTTAKGKLKLERNGLGAVAEVLNTREKYHLPWKDWQLAKYGDRQAMNKLLKYCVNDIHTLEEVYETLLPLMNAHPNVAGTRTNCPVCGSAKSISKGKRYTRTMRYRRRQCKDCSHNYQVGSRL